jgi:ribonuclease HII
MNKTDYEYAEIIDDSDSDTHEEYIITHPKISITTKPATTKPATTKTKTAKVVRQKIIQPVLKKCHNEDANVFEIGVDEVGRGPLFGRVYTAAVILPKDDSFDCSMVKDSKKFHSKKKIDEAAQYIKNNALAWYISYEDEKTIDDINILQATQQSMHNSILEVRKQFNKKLKDEKKEETLNYSYNLLIDGNYFKPVTIINNKTNKIEPIPYITVEGGDNKYASIAAASILAKVERDRYIENLCQENHTLSEYYGIDSNKGYGAKRHLEGIKEHGITIWHRRSFGICKNYV